MNGKEKIKPLGISQGQQKTSTRSQDHQKNGSGHGLQSTLEDLKETQRIVEHMLEGYALLKAVPNEKNTSVDYKITAVNSAFQKLTGKTEISLHNTSIVDLFPSKPQTWIENLEDVRVKGRKKTFNAIHPNKEIIFEVLAYKKNEREIVTLLSDISEKEKLKKEVQQTHKLRSIGLLAGGIAHDFNNILTGVLGNISLVKLYLSRDPKVNRIISDAELSAKRAKSLTRQLLTFSEMGENVRRSFSMSDLLKDTISFVLSGSGVRSQQEIPDNLWTCEIEEGQFYQIINNLIANAIEAMENDGCIGINSQNLVAKDGNPPGLKDGFYVKISINDQGKGISPKEFDQIFNPYFTTKLNGLGLGLSIVKSIVDTNGGFISLKSNLGLGTTFSVYLPALQKKVQLETKFSCSDQTLSGKGRILVMDDEEIIRNFVGTTLQKAGYQIVLTNSGSETLDLFKNEIKAGKKFDALILDLTIPGDFGGKEILEELFMIDPNVKAVVSSGYYNDPAIKNFKNFGFHGKLVKPYNIQEICRVLHNVINDIE